MCQLTMQQMAVYSQGELSVYTGVLHRDNKGTFKTWGNNIRGVTRSALT